MEAQWTKTQFRLLPLSGHPKHPSAQRGDGKQRSHDSTALPEDGDSGGSHQVLGDSAWLMNFEINSGYSNAMIFLVSQLKPNLLK
jgi:hypothetical protein